MVRQVIRSKSKLARLQFSRIGSQSSRKEVRVFLSSCFQDHCSLVISALILVQRFCLEVVSANCVLGSERFRKELG